MGREWRLDEDLLIRNIERVERKGKGYLEDTSFTFEALRGGTWIKYGPQCLGNWSIRSDIQVEIFPGLDWDNPLGCTNDTIPVGWHTLYRLHNVERFLAKKERWLRVRKDDEGVELLRELVDLNQCTMREDPPGWYLFEYPKQAPPITPAIIEARVKEIGDSPTGDIAYGLQMRLYRDLLRAIADDTCSDVMECCLLVFQLPDP